MILTIVFVPAVAKKLGSFWTSRRETIRRLTLRKFAFNDKLMPTDRRHDYELTARMEMKFELTQFIVDLRARSERKMSD